MESQTTKELKIIKDTTLSNGDNKALIKLWKLLVPDYEEFILPVALKPGCSHIYSIDIPLLHNEGLPVFEKTIGEKRLNAILRHCGYGVVFPRQLNQNTLENDISCLRTLECAQYYLSGFKSLIKGMASQLCDAPQDMDTLTKAKYIRNFFIFFSPGEFFTEELLFVQNQIVIDYNKWENLNKFYLFPEETYVLCDRLNSNIHVRYGAIEFAISQLDTKLRKKVLELSELNQVNYPITAKQNYKFKDYRAVKSLIHADHFHLSYTTFAVKEVFNERSFQNFLLSAVIMLLHPISEFNESSHQVRTFENNKLITKEVKRYEYTDEKTGTLYISGEKERASYFELFRYMADHNLKLKGLAYNPENNEPIENHEFEWQVYYALTLFAIQSGYINSEIPLQQSLDNIDALADFYNCDDEAQNYIKRSAIMRYWFSEKNAEDAEALEKVMEIQKRLEEQQLAKEKSIETTIMNFATEHDIEIKNTKQTLEMIHGFWVPYFSDAIANYQESDDSTTFEEAIGFDPFFANAYFNLEDIDVNKIQEKLLDLKRSRATEKQMRRNALLIALYCYLIEGNIPCGSKKRPPTRNKSLRPENLKSFITA